jgi:4-diphosphocytidyl-2C-methyl-D-erythritol kinase
MRGISHAALLSGSGSAIFALAESEREASVIMQKVSNEFPLCFTAISHTTGKGYNIL